MYQFVLFLHVASGGSGLQNLHDRIDAMGGTLEITSGAGGTTVSGTVPLKKKVPV
jgi:signal transduction histidine kinase